MPPLRVHPTNARWLADGDGRAVFLTGSHHWDSLLDNAERPEPFDYPGYLARLADWGHNCVRLWAHEAWTRDLSHSPWMRSGNGLAADGRPRFDLDRFDGSYFARLRERVALAGAQGLWVIVMLFNGWSVRDNGEGNPWPRHPFHRDNNINGVDGDPDGSGAGDAVHSLRLPSVTRRQERYVAQLVETVGDLDCVLWEVANESPGTSAPWQRHVVRHLHGLDAARGPAHPVGLTACFPGGDNSSLYDSAAEWVSPNRHGGWMRTPPANDGSKVVLLDTDHLWGIGGDAAWVWRAALRGHQPLLMDPLDEHPAREAARRAMGVARHLAERIDLGAAAPRPDVAGSGCALVAATASRVELAAWAPHGRVRVDWRRLGPLPQDLAGEWLHPIRGERTALELRRPAGVQALGCPWAGDAVLVVRATAPSAGLAAPSSASRGSIAATAAIAERRQAATRGVADPSCPARRPRARATP